MRLSLQSVELREVREDGTTAQLRIKVSQVQIVQESSSLTAEI
jgi:hypothetical protein